MSDSNFPQTMPPSEKTFFKALFDFEFTEWVTLRVAGVLYAITIVIASLSALIFLIIAFVAAEFGSAWNDPTGFFVALIAVPIGWFLFVLASRLVFEAAIATIAVAQNTASLRK